jgi:hypothetical protein
LRFLAEQFFARYNARDLDGFLALFDFDAPATGGGFGDYADDPGELRQLKTRESLSEYVRARWAIEDTFVSWQIADVRDGLNFPNANPAIAFTRRAYGATQSGNAKLVCNAGLLVGVVMSSR